MAISESHPLDSCKAVPGRCYNRNRPHAPAHASSQLLPLLSLLFMMLAAMPAPCLAQTSESTTQLAVDIVEVTTANPPLLPTSVANVDPHPTVVAAVNETSVRLEAEEAAAAAAAASAAAAAEVDDDVEHNGFVALGGEGLEQGIRNAVKSEVESEIEADSSVLVATIQVNNEETEPKATSNNNEQTAAQGVREPKTLDAEANEAPVQVEEAKQIENVEQPAKEEIAVEAEQVKEEKTAETETEPEKKENEQPLAVNQPEVAESTTPKAAIESDLVESESRPLPSITSDLVAVIFDENRAITEQPITETNLLALEKEHEVLLKVTTPPPTFEVPKHQVTKKQGVDDLLPIDISKVNAETQEEPQAAPDVKEEIQTPNPESVENTKDEHNVDNTSETSVQSAQSVPAAQSVQSVESIQSIQAVQPVQPVQSVKSAVESVELKESVQPIPSVQPVQSAQSVQPVQSVQAVQSVEANQPTEPVQSVQPVQSVESVQHEEPVRNDVEREGKELNVQPAAPSTAQPVHVVSTEPAVQKPVEESAQESSEESVEESAEDSVEPTEANTDQPAAAEAKPEVEQPSVVAVESSSPKSVQPTEPSSTASPVEAKAETSDDSAEDESREESETEKTETETERIVVEPVEKDTSEESEEQSEEEPKAKAEDSTATPLVSYPPHNAGQTFDSNLADERSAHLSLASSSRSTLIIALCSGTAVLFIVISLVIFVLSFQRQHGTLDIEMQEQRLGKDDLDQEDAQMKLLDVDLSPPVIIAMGNEETDECL
ncbi:PREDICTED: probable serine/threonine-protein kinase kinX isoform X2 [Drosophila arizonae]|uniref:Probable serine/threonine-protein kinase kinX isoform X2 n=1 Tax=Drosophila arizonae TaxID=7263 RepID=A0ABM1NM36_DROAR|nr:PREDICTED: probable serine/threonine-protein kinase kinX isoform X2 [Drosophila arizonae]